MRELRLKYEDQEILAIEKDGEPWFVARDVCKALGLVYTGHTLDRIKEDWQWVVKLTTHRRGVQSSKIIAEPAVYKLAFRSNSPAAEKFTDWIASEVIPAIRRTGKYELPATLPAMEEHTRRTVQLENSKKVNGHNFRTGGLLKATEYNRENCIRHTGFRPSELKEFARLKGLKSRQRTSGKEVARQIMPEAACAMSLADVLIGHGHNLEVATNVSRQSIALFKGLLELGERPAELQDEDRFPKPSLN